MRGIHYPVLLVAAGLVAVGLGVVGFLVSLLSAGPPEDMETFFFGVLLGGWFWFATPVFLDLLTRLVDRFDPPEEDLQ
jgi:hypothetical protein